MADLKVQFYKCNSDKRKVDKKIVALGDEFTIYTRGSMNELDPVFVFNNYKTIGEWRDINYLYCPNLERYYYITSKEYDSKGFCTLSCHVDVLKTYANHILGSTQLVNRGEMTKTRNRYIVDNQMPIHSDNAYTIKQASPTIITPNVPSNANLTSSLIMATVGRGTLSTGGAS